MSILDHEDTFFEEAIRRSFIDNAKAVIDSRSCKFEMAGEIARSLKIVTENYFVGEIVWYFDLSYIDLIQYFVLYVGKDGNPEWLRVN